jgi:hypothetical protein
MLTEETESYRVHTAIVAEPTYMLKVSEEYFKKLMSENFEKELNDKLEYLIKLPMFKDCIKDKLSISHFARNIELSEYK